MGKLWRFGVQNKEKTMSAVITLYAEDVNDAEEWVIDFCRQGLIINPLKESLVNKYLNSIEIK